MEHRARRHVPPPPRYPVWLEATITPAVLAIVTALYVLSLHLGLDYIGAVDANGPSETRDERYFTAHAAWVVVAVLGGIGLGAWFRRSLFAFGTLFLVWMLVATVSAQVITFELACRNHNDIIRHWHC